MSRKTTVTDNTRHMNGKGIRPVPVVTIKYEITSIRRTFVSPSLPFEKDNRIVANKALPNNPLTRPGLRLNWPRESETE